MNERRYKMVQATPELLAHMFIPTDRDVRVVADGTIPRTAKFVGGGYDHRTDLMYFMFEDASFDPVPPGERVPLSVPTITWHPSPEAAAGTPYADPPAAVVAMQPMWHPGPRTGDFRADLLAGMLSVNDVLAHLGHPAIPAADGGGARVWMPRQLDAKD